MYSLYAVRGKMSKRGIKTLKGFVYAQNFSMFSLFTFFITGFFLSRHRFFTSQLSFTFYAFYDIF